MSDKPMSLVDEIMELVRRCENAQSNRKAWASMANRVALLNARRDLTDRLLAIESELNELRRIQHANEPELEMPSPERMAALRARARIEQSSALPCSSVSNRAGETGG